MRRLMLVGGSLILGMLLVLGGSAQEEVFLKPEMTWAGKLPGKEKEALQKLAPAQGYVADAKSFARLWRAWRTEEKVPELDFSQKIVLVATVSGPNLVNPRLTLDAQGDLKVNAIATRVGGPGFGYALAVVDRQGIKSINGKPLQPVE